MGSLVGHIKLVTEGSVEGNLPTLDEVKQVFQAHLNKRASKDRTEDLRVRLLAKAKPFLRDTIKLHRLLGDDDTIESLNKLAGLNKTPRFWAGKGLNVELLRNAVRQLEKARAIPDTLLAIYGLLAIVEDTDVVVPSGAHTNRRNLSLYHYLTQIAGWAPEKRNDFMEQLDLMMNKVIQRIAKRATTTVKPNSRRRELPVPW